MLILQCTMHALNAPRFTSIGKASNSSTLTILKFCIQKQDLADLASRKTSWKYFRTPNCPKYKY